MKNLYVGILNTTPSSMFSTRDQIMSECEELMKAAQLHYSAKCVYLLSGRIIVDSPTAHINELSPLEPSWVNEIIDDTAPEVPNECHVWIRRNNVYHVYDGKEIIVLPELKNDVLYITNMNSYANSGKHTIEIQTFLEMIYPWYGKFTLQQLEHVHPGMSTILDPRASMNVRPDEILRQMHMFAVQQIMPIIAIVLNIISPVDKCGHPVQFLRHDKITPYLLMGQSGPIIQTQPYAFYWYPGNNERSPRIPVSMESFAIYSIYDILTELYIETTENIPSWIKFRTTEHDLIYAFKNDFCSDPDYMTKVQYVGYGCVIMAGSFQVRRGDTIYHSRIRPLMTATSVMLCPGYRGFWAIDDNQNHGAEIMARGPIGDFAYYMDYPTMKTIIRNGTVSNPVLYKITVTADNSQFIGPNADGIMPRVGDIVERYWSLNGFTATLGYEPYKSIPTLP